MAPTFVQNLIFFGSFFLLLFFRDVGALWVPLGSLLVQSKALLGGLWTPKTLQNYCFLFKVFANSTFWVFEALDGSLGAIGPFLA